MHNGISATYCRTNGLSAAVKKVLVYTQTVSRGCVKKRLCDGGVKLARRFESKAFPLSTEGTRAGVHIQTRSYKSAETPTRSTMGSERRSSGSRDRGKDYVPANSSLSVDDESEFPPLGASSAKAIRDSSGKGKGRHRAEQKRADVPSKPQQPRQELPRFTGETERQSDLTEVSRSVDNDGREARDRQGAETGMGLGTGDRSDGASHRAEQDGAHVPSKRQQQTQSVSGFSDGPEKQRIFNQDRGSVDHDGRDAGDRDGAEIGKGLGTGERRTGWKNDHGHKFVDHGRQQRTQRVSGFSDGPERQRIYNQDRGSVDHNGREAGDREGAEIGKGLGTGERRTGGKNDHGHKNVPHERQQRTQRVSGFSDQPERQTNSNQDRQSVDHERRGSREGTERQRNSNYDIQGVDHGRYEAGDRQDATWENIDALGKTMTRILRHQAAELNLKMSSDGYVNVRDLLKLPMKTRSHRPLSSHSVDEVKQAVQQDNKQRFGIKEENGLLFIRANQGHTLLGVITEHLLIPIVSADEVPICVHGTYRRSIDQIFEEGLKCMGRNHVHFATGVLGSDGVISGMRTTAQVLIYLNVDKALADGMKLYMSENKVILTEGFEGVVPPKYFKEVCSLPDMKRIEPRSRRA